MTKVVEKNKFIERLLMFTGLDPNKEYDPASPTYDAEMKSLRYGRFAGLTDQDLDGKGQILGLIVSMFLHWWPKLIIAGRLGYIETPIIRVYPKTKGAVLSFTAVPMFKLAQYDKSKYCEPNFYKGQATHSDEESRDMLRDLPSRVITLDYDSACLLVAEALYGKNTELRKEIHSKPLRNWTEEEQIQVVKSRHANLASVLMIETGSFQSDNIARKLDHIIDGQNQAGRKILAGVMKIFRGDNSKRKVADLAGEITRITGYEHGEASMEDSIKYRAFIAVGGRQLPLLLPKGMFGTRKTGTDGAGASRYIYCKLNKNLTKAIFPPVDFDLLKFGSTLEPEYFVPTIPMCALETTQMPGTGWKICTWARDVYDVLDNVRLMVLTDDSATLKAMKPCTYKGSPYQWNGRFVWFQSVQYTVGKYDILDNRTIRITELPLMTWVDNYVLTLIKLLDEELIVDYKDRSTDVDVDIEVKLAIGALDKITSQFGNSTFDPIETYFQLCTPMHNQLNFYDIGCKVYSTKDYEEILHRWFPVRKELYSRRVDRVIILLEIRIFQMESVIKYLRSALDLRGQSLVQINKIIAEAGYNRLNVGLLDSPGTLQNAELRAAIIDGPGSTYNYLINLRDYDRSSEQMERFEAKLSDLRSELERYLSKSNEGKFKGAAIWLDELAEIRKIIDDGARTGWKFEDFQRYTF